MSRSRWPSAAWIVSFPGPPWKVSPTTEPKPLQYSPPGAGGGPVLAAVEVIPAVPAHEIVVPEAPVEAVVAVAALEVVLGEVAARPVDVEVEHHDGHVVPGQLVVPGAAMDLERPKRVERVE